VYPWGATEHVPSAGAPRATVHTLQEPEHVELQHTPSTQFPDAHWRHCPWRQSTPAVGLQERPSATCTWHVPFAPQ
jgi:hypothetical protein